MNTGHHIHGPVAGRHWSRRSLLGMAAAMASVAGLARAQTGDWPSRPVRLIVPSAAGGPTDTFARIFADDFGKAFGQPFIVENRPGANGLIGNDTVAKARPDGQVLLFSYAAAVAINHAFHSKLPYDALKDLVPIAQIGAGGTLFVVSNEFPARNLREFVDTVRAQPGRYEYASWGQGSGGHLAMESLKLQAGLDIRHIPYKGIPQILTDLQNGVLRVGCVDMTTSMPHIKSGRLRPIAIAGTHGVPGLPGVPTLNEGGYKFDMDAWFGLFGPSGTPSTVVQKLNAEVNRMLQLPTVRERFTQMNLPNPPVKSPEQFAQTLRQDIESWAAVIKAARIQPE